MDHCGEALLASCLTRVVELFDVPSLFFLASGCFLLLLLFL